MHFRTQKKLGAEISIQETIDTDHEGNPLTYIDIIAQEDTIADDLDKKLLEVSVPNEFDADTLLGNGFITPYNGRIFIPVDGSSLANTK